MRRTLTLLILGSLLTVGFVAAQSQKIPSNCTQTGTPSRDIMTGGPGPDKLCALEGDDYLHGDGSSDVLKSGMGNDTAVGAGGRDIIRGGRGNDRLFAVDDRGGERVIGGRGRDQCFTDRGDIVFGCEQTFRGLSLQVVRGLSRTAFNLMEIAEEALSTPVPIPGPPGPSGPPGPPGVFPPCTPPPATPPSPIC